MVFEDLLDKNPKVAVNFEDKRDRQIIKDLILGEGAGYGDKQWQFEIVSNSRNGIDVDKFDYLARDT
jgi:deoxynucleoside triphosphate triphosphohydrolase SAMHD1